MSTGSIASWMVAVGTMMGVKSVLSWSLVSLLLVREKHVIGLALLLVHDGSS